MEKNFYNLFQIRPKKTFVMAQAEVLQRRDIVV